MARVNGGGAGRRETLSRSGASPERIKYGPPRVDSSGAWVGTHLCGMRDSMVALARHGKARGGARISDGGGHGGALPANGVLGALGLRITKN